MLPLEIRYRAYMYDLSKRSYPRSWQFAIESLISVNAIPKHRKTTGEQRRNRASSRGGSGRKQEERYGKGRN